MAASGAPGRQPRRGPAPIASFDHDGSDESSPETKQAHHLPEIREDSSSVTSAVDSLAPPEQRARSQSTPAAVLPAPRIDISRASSSSHHDSRDSSPELALFTGTTPGAGELGFREDGALDLRSSTEELAFLEPAPGEARPPPPPAPPSRRHSRKDSQGSEAALLAVSGRTSRLSSVGSQCSAHSALSAYSHASQVSRLSVASGVSRSPSPHKMLLETSFCGPKPIETDPEICAAAVEERLLEMAKLTDPPPAAPTPAPIQVTAPIVQVSEPPPVKVSVPPVCAPPVSAPVDARDRREVRTEATVERTTSRPSTRPATNTAPTAVTPVAPVTTVAPVTIIAPSVPKPAPPPAVIPDDDKKLKETRNQARAEERRARSRERRDPAEPRTNKSRSKDIIRIRLKPSEEYDDDDDDDEDEEVNRLSGAALKPATLELSSGRPTRPTDLAANDGGSTITPRRTARDSRTPSPAGVIVSRKSSFCSLFKSRETIASPESPSDALRRKKSLNDGRSRSRSRDRSTTPTSATKIRGSVLSLFRTPRKSATSPSPSSREGSPIVQSQRHITQPPPEKPRRGERLKYYEDAKNGIIHIPLRTPPDEANTGGKTDGDIRPASAPQPRIAHSTSAMTATTQASTGTPVISSTVVSRAPAPAKPKQRTVLPDGSIIIPLHSPTEKTASDEIPIPAAVRKADTPPELNRPVEPIARPSSTISEPVTSPKSPAAKTSSGELTTPPEAPAETSGRGERSHRRERLVFMTHVGSRDQVFSTQFSITKTPSVTSEISGSFPSFPDTEDNGVTAGEPAKREASIGPSEAATPGATPAASSPQEAPEVTRDSSESEASSEAAPARGGSDVEQRGLVVQESFEEELPYVPTTLPQERSLALPMVPVRERGGVHVAAVERPRAAPRPTPRLPVAPNLPAAPGLPTAPRLPAAPRLPPAPPPPRPVTAPDTDKIRIRLPRRPRTGSASAPPRPARARTRSGSDGMETRPKTEWIDFEELPERRKQPKRIQTLPSAAVATAEAGETARDVVFNYVEPEECRCECHARADDETPLLDDDPRLSVTSLECEEARLELSVQVARPAAPAPALAAHPPALDDIQDPGAATRH